MALKWPWNISIHLQLEGKRPWTYAQVMFSTTICFCKLIMYFQQHCYKILLVMIIGLSIFLYFLSVYINTLKSTKKKDSFLSSFSINILLWQLLVISTNISISYLSEPSWMEPYDYFWPAEFWDGWHIITLQSEHLTVDTRSLHGQRSLVGQSPWDCKESDTTEWPTLSPDSPRLPCSLRYNDQQRLRW